MTDYQPSPPRLSIELTDDLKEILDQIPHGLKKPLFQRFIRDLGAAIDRDERVLPAIISGTVNSLRISPTFKKALEIEDDKKRNT
jgi:hypothetical protein